MKFTKFAAGTITTIIALWIGMWVLKFLAAALVVGMGFLATLVGLAFVVVKVIFICLLVVFVVGVAYMIYSIFFKTKSSE